MWVKINCPACQTESTSSWPTASYKGKYRCWKCHGLFAIEVVDGEMVSYQPLSEAEFEEQKAREEAEKKGLPYTPKSQAPAAPVTYLKPAEPATPTPPPPPPAAPEPPAPTTQTPSNTPNFLEEVGRPKAGGGPQGIQFTKPEATSEAPTTPPQASSVPPQASPASNLPKDEPAVTPPSSTPASCANATPTPPPAPKSVEPKVEAPRPAGKVIIDAFNFGFIVVNGKQYAYDVIISPDGTVSEREPGRGRIGSHSITGNQIDPLLRASPEVVLVGTGMRGMARLSEQRSNSVNIRVMTSPEAVEEFNKLAAQGKRVGALIHITC